MTTADIAHPGLRTQLLARIRDVPDYPKPGVMFKDITPLLADPAAFGALVDALAEAVPAARRGQGRRPGGSRIHPGRPRGGPAPASASCRSARPASCPGRP